MFLSSKIKEAVPGFTACLVSNSCRLFSEPPSDKKFSYYSATSGKFSFLEKDFRCNIEKCLRHVLVFWAFSRDDSRRDNFMVKTLKVFAFVGFR